MRDMILLQNAVSVPYSISVCDKKLTSCFTPSQQNRQIQFKNYGLYNCFIRWSEFLCEQLEILEAVVINEILSTNSFLTRLLPYK